MAHGFNVNVMSRRSGFEGAIRNAQLEIHSQAVRTCSEVRGALHSRVVFPIHIIILILKSLYVTIPRTNMCFKRFQTIFLNCSSARITLMHKIW